jgi:hypothetical protein
VAVMSILGCCFRTSCSLTPLFSILVNIYMRNADGSWPIYANQVLTGDRGTNELYYGTIISLYNSTLAVGTWEKVNGLNNAGRVYMYTRTGNTWSNETKLIAPTPAQDGWFGAAGVSVSADTVVIGEHGKNKFYVYSISSPTTPTINPTSNPITSSPTSLPTSYPTDNPTPNPITSSPTSLPTSYPTDNPTLNPITSSPTSLPTSYPTDNPTPNPITSSPTSLPTKVSSYRHQSIFVTTDPTLTESFIFCILLRIQQENPPCCQPLQWEPSM